MIEKRIRCLGAGEMAQGLRVHGAFSKDLGLVPSTLIRQLQLQRIQCPLLDSMGTYIHMHIYPLPM